MRKWLLAASAAGVLVACGGEDAGSEEVAQPPASTSPPTSSLRDDCRYVTNLISTYVKDTKGNGFGLLIPRTEKFADDLRAAAKDVEDQDLAVSIDGLSEHFYAAVAGYKRTGSYDTYADPYLRDIDDACAGG